MTRKPFAASGDSGGSPSARTDGGLPSSTHAGGELPPLTMYGHWNVRTKSWALWQGIAKRFGFEYEAVSALRDYAGDAGIGYVVRPFPKEQP